MTKYWVTIWPERDHNLALSWTQMGQTAEKGPKKTVLEGPRPSPLAFIHYQLKHAVLSRFRQLAGTPTVQGSARLHDQEDLRCVDISLWLIVHPAALARLRGPPSRAPSGEASPLSFPSPRPGRSCYGSPFSSLYRQKGLQSRASASDATLLRFCSSPLPTWLPGPAGSGHAAAASLRT